MNILWLRWKDINHPDGGGAEIVAHEIAKRAIKDGHTITTTSSRYSGSTSQDTIDGVQIIRMGKRLPFHYIACAFWLMFSNLSQYDLIIEEVNTVPYFSWFLTRLRFKKIRHMYFYHQLCRETWYYQIHPLLQHFGYFCEYVYTHILSLTNLITITVSESSLNDLVDYGFGKKNIYVISEGIVCNQGGLDFKNKNKQFTVLYHGSLRPMKRPEDVITGFYNSELYKKDARLWLTGGGDRSGLERLVKDYNLESYVTFFGRVSEQEKLSYMAQAHVLCSTSVKEGWGLIVSEANSVGTPAIGYDVDGLRDSIRFGIENILVEPNPLSISKSMQQVYNEWSTDKANYSKRCSVVQTSAKKLTFDQSYKDFMSIINSTTKKA